MDLCSYGIGCVVTVRGHAETLVKAPKRGVFPSALNLRFIARRSFSN